MDDVNLPPLIEESTTLRDGRTHIIIRTNHGVYAQATVLKGEERDWLAANRPLALDRLRNIYSRSTIPIDSIPRSN